MPKLPGSALVAMAALFGLATPAAAQLSTEVPVYQGAVFVTAANAACREEGVEAGTTFSALFRSQRRPNNGQGGGLHFIGARQVFTYVKSDNQSLPGGSQQGLFRGLGTSAQVGVFGYTSKYNLSISPANITRNTLVVSLTGTLTNVNGVGGCTAAIRGAFVKRP